MFRITLKIIIFSTLITACIFWKVANATSNYTLDLRHLGVEEGLSQSTLTSVTEDIDGYIWFGTLNGLNRFDGVEFKKYFHHLNNGLNSSFIQSLKLIDETLFVGTNSGIYKYNSAHDKFTNLSGITEPIWSINSTNNNILIGLNDGILILDKKNDTINYEYRNEKIKGVKQTEMVGDEVIIRTYNGELYSLNVKSGYLTLLDYGVSEISKSNKSILKLKDKILSNESITIANNIDAFTSNHDEIIYLTEGEIYSTNKNLGSNKYYPIGFNLDIKDIERAKIYSTTNYIIISNETNGIFLSSKKKNYSMQLATISNPVWSISKNNDSIFISDDTEKLKIFDRHLSVIQTINIPVSGPKFIVSTKDKLYIGTQGGLYIADLASGKVKKIDDRLFTSGIFVNNRVYLNSENSNVVAFDSNTDLEIYSILIKPEQQLLDIEHFNNYIFIAHQDGISKVDLNLSSQEVIFSGEISYSLKSLTQSLLFSTNNGIYRLNGSSITKEFNSNDPIYSIDGDENYLIATSLGKYYKIFNGKYYTYSSEFGSQDEYNTQSTILHNDYFLAGGMSGVSVIPKKIDIDINPEFITKLTDLQIFNSVVTPGSELLPQSLDSISTLTLKYSDYPFSINFKSPSSGLKNVNYYYRLIGLSDSWLSSEGNNQATYTNLSPGVYRFEIYAVNPVLGSPGKTKYLNIEITPPWWMSKEAKFTYALIAILLSMAVIKAILRKREVQRQIAISEERLKLSLWGSGDEMWDWDIETGKIYRSNIWGSLEFPKDGHRSGTSDEESNIHPQDQQRVREELNRHFYGETDHFEAAYRVKGKDDHWVWILDRAKIVERDETDNALRMTGTIKNINNFKLAEEQLRLFERAIENISEGMFILDSNFCFVEVNEACCDVCLIDREGFIGTTLAFSCYPETYSEQVRGMLRQQGSWSAEVDYKRGDGSIFLMELTLDAIYDEQGSLSHFVGVFSDISRRKQQEEELRKLTNNDLLTGLPNRSNLQVSLSNLVKKDTHHTLMVLDLDNFKKINDSLGHQIGDELLLMASKRITNALPHHTSLYRLGGDEFAILVDEQTDIGASATIAKSMVDAFDLPFELAGEKIVVGISIGIVLYPDDEQNEQALLRKADIAMYHAKSAGGNSYQFYSESLNRNAMRQLEIENLIREGLRDDLFEVYYQPKVDLKNSRLAGMEALVRLVHPVHGLVPPSDFIPLAEDTGLIIDIGDLVLRKACFAAQKWRAQGLFNGRVAVNLSSRQFALPDLQQRIESILRLTQLPATNLELEITEGTVIKHPENAIKVMQQLAKMGVSLALDDFGTGYSSLSYLKRFPIHCLKIDKAFVDDIDKSDRDLKMVDSIITIAHNMGLTVVGEGVEAPAQLNILRALNCEEVQGYIYSKAVPEREFGELLKKDFSEFINKKYHL